MIELVQRFINEKLRFQIPTSDGHFTEYLKEFGDEAIAISNRYYAIGEDEFGELYHADAKVAYAFVQFIQFLQDQ